MGEMEGTRPTYHADSYDSGCFWCTNVGGVACVDFNEVTKAPYPVKYNCTREPACTRGYFSPVMSGFAETPHYNLTNCGDAKYGQLAAPDPQAIPPPLKNDNTHWEWNH